MAFKVEDMDLALPYRLAVVALVHGLNGEEDGVATVLSFDARYQLANIYSHVKGHTAGAMVASSLWRSSISRGPHELHSETD